MTPGRDAIGPDIQCFPARAGTNRKCIISRDISAPSFIVVSGSPNEKASNKRFIEEMSF